MHTLIIALQTPAIITGFFTIFGSSMAVIGTIFVTRRDDKRHIRELGLKLALVNLEQRIKEQQAIADATGKIQEVLPLPVLVAESMRVAEIVSNPRLSGDEIGRRLAGLSGFAGTMLKAMQPKEQRRQH